MPLDPKLTKYTTTSPVLLNVSLNDFIQNAGVVSFLGYATTDSAGENFHLGTTEFFGDPIGEEHTTPDTSSFVKQGDYDFDTSTFSIAATIRGTATFNMTFRGQTASPDQHLQFIIKLRKWDGTTETEIASVTSEDMVDEGSSKVLCMEMTVAKTRINVGETLRVTLETYSYRDGGAGATYSVVFDPQNRDWVSPSANTNISSSANITTKFIANIPFEITEIAA